MATGATLRRPVAPTCAVTSVRVPLYRPSPLLEFELPNGRISHQEAAGSPLDTSCEGNLRRIAMTSYDVVKHVYEDPHVQAYILWQAFQTAQAVDSPGSGLLAYSIVAGRQVQSWTLPLGGSGARQTSAVER